MADSNPDAPNADSTSLIKKSVWCGAVCALAVVLTSLNLYPPVDVQYKVSTRVVVAEARLEQLKAVLARDRKAMAAGRLRYVQLYKLNLLDEVKNDGLMLVELESLWTGRATSTHIEAWLSKVTQPDSRQLVNSEEACADRFARWQAETAKHYLKRHQYICSANKTTSSAQNESQLASGPIAGGVRATFATMTTSGATGIAATPVSGQLEFDDPVRTEKTLTDSLKQAEAVAIKSQQMFTTALDKHAGAIEIVGTPRVRSKTSNIPLWMSASVIILAMATGAIASLLQYRIQSGGAFDPEFTAAQLKLDGLPVVAKLELAPLGHEPSSRSAQGVLNAFKNATGRHLGQVGEVMLLIWCVAITCRMLFDPLWRSVVMDSPLAAFGRLVTGMP